MQTYPGQMPPTNWCQVYITLLHQNSITYWQMQTYPGQMDPSANQPQVYRALLQQTVVPIDKCWHTWGRWSSPPQIEPKCTVPYYTKIVWNCTLQMYPVPMYPPNWAHLYRALLHQDNMTYCRMQRYLVPIAPQLIKLTYTELYYTRTVCLLKNAEEPSAYWKMQTYSGQMAPNNWPQVYISLPHQTVLPIDKCRHTQSRWPPMLIDPKCT